MMLFKLRCAAGHEFDGWFRDNAAYDRQAASGEIACPVCADTAVEKAPMAPRLGRSRRQRAEVEAPPAPAPAPAKPAPGRMPSPPELRHAFQALRRNVEANCDYVGPRFAEEARRMHRGESEARGIYGEATQEDSKKLADEGIEIASIPWVPLNDA